MDKLPPRNRKRATAEALNKIAQLKRDIARDQTRITFLRRYVAAMVRHVEAYPKKKVWLARPPLKSLAPL